jgi:hypothetical protein
MWDRYGKIEFAYGEQPFKEQLIKIPAGTILFPAEGEGRNAIYRPHKAGMLYALIKV